MIDYRDACVSCGLPCDGRCDYFGKYYPVAICDKCGHEANEAYELNGDQLCEDCLLEALPVVETDDEEECEECGDYTCYRYEYEGKIICSTCLKELTHIVDLDGDGGF